MADIADYTFLALDDMSTCQRVEITLPVVTATEANSVTVTTNPTTSQKIYTIVPDTTSITLSNVIAAPDGLSAGQWLKPETRAATAAEFQTVGAERIEVPFVAMGALWGNRAAEPAAAHRGMMNPDGTLGHFVPAATFANFTTFNGAYLGINTGATPGPIAFPYGAYVGQTVYVAFYGNQPEVRVDGSFRGTFRDGQHIIGPHAYILSVIARPGEGWVLRWTGARWERLAGTERMLSGVNWRENSDGTITAQILGQGNNTNLNPGQHVVFDITVPFAMLNPTAVVPVISDYNAANTPALGVGTVPVATSPMVLMAFPLSNTFTTVRIGGWHMGAAGAAISQVGVVNVLLDRVVPDYAALGGIASF